MTSTYIVCLYEIQHQSRVNVKIYFRVHFLFHFANFVRKLCTCVREELKKNMSSLGPLELKPEDFSLAGT